MDLHQIKLEILDGLLAEYLLSKDLDRIYRLRRMIERLDYSIELDYSLNVY